MDYTALLMLIIVILIFVGAVWFGSLALVSELRKNVLVMAPMTFRPKM